LPLIKLSHIYKTYQVGNEKRDVLKNVSLSINPGELTAIVGASGSGKSTLMNIIGLLDHPTSGEYLLEEQNFLHLTSDELASIRNRQIGFIFQFFYLLPRLSALENIMMPLMYQHIAPADAEQVAAEWLAKMGLGHIAQQKPNQLSGGQQQRVAIARALATNPTLLLADEPTGALDSKTSEDILRIFLDLHAQTHKTIIMVTHNPIVAQHCQRIIQITDGEIVDDRYL